VDHDWTVILNRTEQRSSISCFRKTFFRFALAGAKDDAAGSQLVFELQNGNRPKQQRGLDAPRSLSGRDASNRRKDTKDRYSLHLLPYGAIASCDTSTRSTSFADEITVRLLGLHELDLESDGDLVADQNAPGLERSVPGQAEVLAIDLRSRRDRNPGVAPWVLARRGWTLHSKINLAGYSVNCQVALDRQLSVTDDADA